MVKIKACVNEKYLTHAFSCYIIYHCKAEILDAIFKEKAQGWCCKMDKFEEMALLLDIYGELLTEKQRDVMDQYYNYDLSLQEIAENEGISKQGVHDLIRRAEHSLLKADEKLGFRKRLSGIRSGLENISNMLEDISGGHEQLTDGQASKLKACREEIDRLINTCLGG